MNTSFSTFFAQRPLLNDDQVYVEAVDYITISKFVDANFSAIRIGSYTQDGPFRYGRLGLCLLGAILNAFFFISNLINNRRRSGILKVRLLILLLSLTVALWSIAIFCIFLGEVLVAEVDEIADILSKIRADENTAFAWRVMLDTCLQPLFDSHALILFAVSLDRYLNLYRIYWPHVESKRVLVALLVVPIFCCFVVFNPLLVYSLLPFESFLYCRLTLLLFPSVLSFLLLTVCVLSKGSEVKYEPGFSISLCRSLPRVLFVIVTLDILMRTAMFFRLIEDNLQFVVVTGSEQGDAILQTFFDISLQVAVCMSYLFPIYVPLLLMFGVKHFRDTTVGCCKSDKKVRTV